MADLLLAQVFIILLAPSDQKQFFEKVPQNASVAAGSTVVLECQIGNKKGLLAWIKGTSILGSGSDRRLPNYPRYSLIGSVRHGNYHLQIKPVQVDDEAWYTCKVTPFTNEEEHLEARALLSVYSPPKEENYGIKDGSGKKLENKADYYYRPLNGGVTFTCFAHLSSPAADVTWHKNFKEEIKGLKTNVDTVPPKYFNTETVLYMITSENSKSNDVYECRIHYSLWTSYASIHFKLIKKGPNIKKNMDDITAARYTDIVFRATYDSGYIVSSFQWSVKIKGGPKRRILGLPCDRRVATRGSEKRSAVFRTTSTPHCFSGKSELTVPYIDPKYHESEYVFSLKNKNGRVLEDITAKLFINEDTTVNCKERGIDGTLCECKFVEAFKTPVTMYFNKLDNNRVECEFNEVSLVLGLRSSLYEYICRSTKKKYERFEFHVEDEAGRFSNRKGVCVATETTTTQSTIATTTEKVDSPSPLRTINYIILVVLSLAIVIYLSVSISKAVKVVKMEWAENNLNPRSMPRDFAREVIYRSLFRKESIKQRLEKLFKKPHKRKRKESSRIYKKDKTGKSSRSKHRYSDSGLQTNM